MPSQAPAPTKNPGLRPVSDTDVRVEYRMIHGYRRAFRIAGRGPALLLIHGIGDNSSTWDEVIPILAQHYTCLLYTSDAADE